MNCLLRRSTSDSSTMPASDNLPNTYTHTERTIIITPWTIITVYQKILEQDGKLFPNVYPPIIFMYKHSYHEYVVKLV